MSSDDGIFDQFLQEYSTLSISLTLTLIICCLFVSAFTCYALNQLLRKKAELHARLKLFAVISSLSFIVYICSIILAMIFYQCHMLRKYTYCIAFSLLCGAVAQQSLYIVFLQTLYTTFKRSKYQIGSTMFRFIICCIVINGMLCVVQSVFWLQYRISRQISVQHVWYLSLCQIPLMLFYSIYIISLFGSRLFTVSLSRMDEQKTQQYRSRVLSATASIIEQHKATLTKLTVHRSYSDPAVEPEAVDRSPPPPQASHLPTDHETPEEDLDDDVCDIAPVVRPSLQPFARSRSEPVTPRTRNAYGNGSMNGRQLSRHPLSLDRALSIDTDAGSPSTVLQQPQPTTPSLRQRKSMNVMRFNKENKHLLDVYQLNFIHAASRYTYLSSISFLSALCTLTATAMARIFNASLEEFSMATSSLNFEMIVLFVMALNAIISVLSVLFMFSMNSLCTKIYKVLCFPSLCCLSCFRYFALRKLMTRIEDKLQREIEEEYQSITRAEQEMDFPSIPDGKNVHSVSDGSFFGNERDSNTRSRHKAKSPSALLAIPSHSEEPQTTNTSAGVSDDEETCTQRDSSKQVLDLPMDDVTATSQSTRRVTPSLVGTETRYRTRRYDPSRTFSAKSDQTSPALIPMERLRSNTETETVQVAQGQLQSDRNVNEHEREMDVEDDEEEEPVGHGGQVSIGLGVTVQSMMQILNDIDMDDEEEEPPLTQPRQQSVSKSTAL